MPDHRMPGDPRSMQPTRDLETEPSTSKGARCTDRTIPIRTNEIGSAAGSTPHALRFEPLTLRHDADGTAVLSGPIPDQGAPFTACSGACAISASLFSL